MSFFFYNFFLRLIMSALTLFLFYGSSAFAASTPRFEIHILPAPSESVRGGGGTDSPSPVPVSRIVLSGRSPQGHIFLLQDGQRFIQRLVALDGTFEFIIPSATPGRYSFALQAEQGERRTPLLTIPLTVVEGNTASVSGIELLPYPDVIISPKELKGDLDGDGRVNLVDFSIGAFWYKRSLESSFTLIEGDKLNGDQKMDLVDFSIMAFYWTG